MAKKLKSFFITFLITSLLCLFVIWSTLERGRTIELVKKEIIKIQESLNEAGYDIAYEEITFSRMPFFIMKMRDFKIYSLDADKYAELHIPEVKLNSGYFNFGKIYISLSPNQYIQYKRKTYIADLPELDISVSFADGVGLKDINISGRKINIENLASIEEFKLASQRMAPHQVSEFTPFFENHLEMRKIKLADDVNLPISKFIERVYLNANIIGVIKSQDSYQKSVMSWLTLGGIVDIKKLIVNWDILSVVGRGDLYFNENLSPNVHLTISSKGLLEVLETLQNAELLDNKGAFVVKILLNGKSFKINESDMYSTVTTPININADELSVENIPIIKF